MMAFNSIAAYSNRANTWPRQIRSPLRYLFGVLYVSLCGGYAQAADAPENIRLEQNRMVWDFVAGVSTFDVYLMSSDHPNANGTYLATVVDGNEYTLSTVGVYSVVSAAPNFSYSALHSADRVKFGN